MRRETYERILRRVRNSNELWGELGERKEQQARRIIALCKLRLAPHWEQRRSMLEHALGQRILYLYH